MSLANVLLEQYSLPTIQHYISELRNDCVTANVGIDSTLIDRYQFLVSLQEYFRTYDFDKVFEVAVPEPTIVETVTLQEEASPEVHFHNEGVAKVLHEIKNEFGTARADVLVSNMFDCALQLEQDREEKNPYTYEQYRLTTHLNTLFSVM